MTECPHCLTHVLVKADGTCPACGAKASGTTPWTKLTVRIGQRLPAYCIRCGAGTERLRRVVRTRKRGGEHLLVKLFVAVFYPGALSRVRPAEKHSVAVHVPICDLCAAEGPIEPRSVDFEAFTMEFVAHRDFIRRASAG